ncbi:hypothetical protein DY218_11670 [Streptomyces triticagri]|uniref:Lipoprotein n=1 Tax=Streptomyces triticagri TaxID=2293568 RepID=A0A372M6V0_9ACTN|nr:hypothetical protein [Streptomyces triticagri]RFU86569.1 hypothetical protein DY218_11670 [Streptomyces triticagri]
MRRPTRILACAALVLALPACGAFSGGHGDGPGTRTAFVKLGIFRASVPQPAPSSSATPAPPLRPGSGDLRPTRLGPSGHADQMYASLERAEVQELPEARKALRARPADDLVGLAFVLPGCQHTGARLEVDDKVVSASLTGADNVHCDAAEYFLATFTIPADELPDDWTLRNRR